MQILVVDDEPGITRLCERLLRKENYAVTSFTDPIVALKYLEKNKVDLLLADIRMPEISGFDVIARLHQYQPDAASLIMTGFGTVETAIQALRQGVDGLLLKPFDTGSELIQAVQQALVDCQKRRDVARISALRPLFDIIEGFLGETRPDRLLDLVLNAICGHMRCENAGFYQFSAEDRKLRIVASRGNVLPEEESGAENGVIGRTDALGVPLWITMTGPSEEGLQKLLNDHALCSIMCAPISRQNVRGVFFAARGVETTPFREVDWEMFLLLARQSAIAMENARLYEELREYVRRVEDSQQALIRAEKMATAGRLTASIAHEINNPLQAVQNCLHLATREELGPKKQREYLDLANTELERLMSTVQRMLDFYRPGRLEPQQVDLAASIRHVLGLMAPQLDSRGIHVTTSFSSRLPLISAVSSQLEQVFINLILNAYDAMPKGGELRISARLIRDTVEVLFHDNGPGVSDELRNKIFEPFVSSKEGGTGLGLSVSYGIISAHGGNLDLVPDRYPGACFRVTLPAKGEK